MLVLDFAYEYNGYDGQDDPVPEGLTQVIAYGWEGGYGHCNFYVVGERDNQFWGISGGGCSCGGSRDVNGPFKTVDEARKYIGELHYDLKPDATMNNI